MRALRARDAEHKALLLRLEVPPGAERHVLGDAGRVRQVLVNLIGNAIKFTERGGVKLRLCPERAGDRVRVYVDIEDTGIGIAEEHLPHLFAEFQQLDASTTRRFGGTGLGLSICQRLCQQMGGEVTCSSQLGKGSTFTATFCLEPAEGGVAAATSHPLAALPPARVFDLGGNARPPRVLIVELSTTSSTRPCSGAPSSARRADVAVASDGLEALRRLEQQPFDVVLMGCQMPGLDGYEATRQIRAREAPGERRLIFAATAGAMGGDRERCLAAGMDDHLAKPSHMAVVVAAFARHGLGAPPEA